MPKAVMTITIEEDGSTTVTGPLDQPLVFHGMIGCAVDTLRMYQDTKKSARVQLASDVDKALVGLNPFKPGA